MLLDKRSGFTMIEVVFVIVVIGILAAIAIPRFAATRDDAQIAKGRSDIAAIRSAIVTERQTRLLRGDILYINHLDHVGGAASSDGDMLFDNNGTATNILLQYGIASADKNGHWKKTAADAYAFKIMNVDVAFTYTQTSGTFMCDTTNGTYGEKCKLLVN